jgi:hypothetical protein
MINLFKNSDCRLILSSFQDIIWKNVEGKKCINLFKLIPTKYIIEICNGIKGLSELIVKYIGPSILYYKN